MDVTSARGTEIINCFGDLVGWLDPGLVTPAIQATPRRRTTRIISTAWRGITKAVRVLCCCSRREYTFTQHCSSHWLGRCRCSCRCRQPPSLCRRRRWVPASDFRYSVVPLPVSWERVSIGDFLPITLISTLSRTYLDPRSPPLVRCPLPGRRLSDAILFGSKNWIRVWLLLYSSTWRRRFSPSVYVELRVLLVCPVPGPASPSSLQSFRFLFL